MIRNRRFMTRAAACMTMGLAVTGAIATADSDDPVSGTQISNREAADAEAAPVAAIEPEQSEELASLRRARTTDDALPSEWREDLKEDTEEGEIWGANPSLSRRTAPGVWLVPGDGYVCVANTTPGEGSLGFGCATPEDVERGFLAPSDVDANGNGVVTGVMPDHVATVELVNRDGSARTVQVERNTYRAAIDAELKEIRFIDPAGVQRVLPMAWSR